MKIDNNDCLKYKDVDIKGIYTSKIDDCPLTMEYNLLKESISIDLWTQQRYHFIMDFIKSLEWYESKSMTGIYTNFLCRGLHYSDKQMIAMHKGMIKAEKIRDKQRKVS